MNRRSVSISSMFKVAAGIVLATFLVAGFDTPANAQATLKIGHLADMTNPLGRDDQKLVEVMVAQLNQKGGLQIGSQKYKVELLTYDTKGTAETGRAAVERLVFKDKIKVLLGEETVDAWYQVTERNKVVTVIHSPSPLCVNSKLK